jgi:hypothetical protein
MTRLSDAAPIVLRGMGGSCKPVCITTSTHGHTNLVTRILYSRLLGRSGRRLLGTATQ